MTEDTRPLSRYTLCMQFLRDQIAPVAFEFGIATARSLIIQKRWRENGEMRDRTFEVEPKPIIGRKPPQIQMADNTSISIKQDLFLVEGITRNYPKENIVGTGINYWVDATMTSEGIAGGFKAEFFSMEEMPLTWNLILRRILDERRGI